LSSDSVSFDLVSYNKISKVYQTVFTFPQVTKRYYYINGIIIYDNLSKTYAYNIETGENSLVYEHLNEFRSFTIFEIGDHIALSFTNKSSGPSGPYELKLISLNDFNIQSIPVDDAVIDIYPSLIQGKIIYEEHGKTIIHDLSSNEKVTFNTFNTSQYYIAEDKYLVHLDFDTLRVLDIFTKKEMPHSVPITFKTLFFSIKAIKINDKYIFNIYNNNENDKKLFQIDLKNQTVSNYEFEPYAPNGLFSRANIALNDSTLLLFDKNLYHIEGKEYTQLNTSQKEVINYKIIGGILFWIQDNVNNLEVYQFSESVVSKVGDIQKSELMQSDLFNFKDFGVINGDIYFTEGYYDATLNMIKQGSTVVKRIDNVDAPTSGYQIMIHKGNLYYPKGETVRVILQDESIHNTFLSVDPSSRFEKIILNDKMFYVNDKAIVHIDGKDYDIITEMEVRGGLNFPIKKINDSHILILKADKTYDIFDGISLKKSTLPENVTLYLIVSEKYIIASKLETTGVYKSYLYDFNQNMSLALPDSISSLQLIKVFNYFGKNIFVAKKGKDPFSKLVMYEMSDDFQTYQLIKSIDVIGSNLKFNFEQYQNEGLIYVGDKIYIMDENLNITQLEDISGDPSQNKIILREGYFYFIALHPLHGRQLFRVQPLSLRTDTDNTPS
ncbi:MAG TPA: hypothetical protein PJ990_11095, partial [Saprospiraceae bacterium]|nr:hypothetical protein [Saprospiraceae bacterium]